MIIKDLDDRAQDIQTLEALLTHPDASIAIRKKITQQMMNIRAGLKGEKDAAYHINFHLKDSKNWAVIHDIRFEHAGRVAQIDHLLINRGMEIWLCESKYWSNGIAINEHGEFTSFYGNTPKGISSPLEQNHKHVTFLKKLIRDNATLLPKLLGIPIKPDIFSVVLVSTNARITRPKVKIDGLETIIKADQIASYIDKRIKNESSLLSTFKITNLQAVETFATRLASLHKPHKADWAANYGLKKVIGRHDTLKCEAIQTQPSTDRTVIPRSKKSSLSERDNELLLKLEAKRRDIARSIAKPAFMVFSNATLKDMAQKRPASRNEMLDVSGVGPVKLDQFGDMFLDVILAI